MDEIRERIKKFRRYIKMTDGDKVARRYFIMNSFDGVVTMLGLLISMYFTGFNSIDRMITVSLCTALAMSISGIAGAFIAEKSEREIEITELERAMLSDLSHSIYADAIKYTIIWVSFVNAVSPLIATSIIITPLMLEHFHILNNSPVYSVIIALTYLFILGVKLAKMTGKNMLIGGLKMIAIGILTALILIVLLR